MKNVWSTGLNEIKGKTTDRRMQDSEKDQKYTWERNGKLKLKPNLKLGVNTKIIRIHCCVHCVVVRVYKRVRV